MTTRLVFNFRYDASTGYVADSLDMKLGYEKLLLDYRPACYVLVETGSSGGKTMLTPHILKFVNLIEELVQLQHHHGGDDGVVATSTYTCYITDIVLRGERVNFLRSVINDLGLDLMPDFKGQLVVVEFTAHSAYKFIYGTLQNNSLPWYRLLPDFCEIGVAMQTYKCAFGIPMATKGAPPHVECLGFKVTDRIDLCERFRPIGFYHTFTGTSGIYTKLHMLTFQPSSMLQHVLPVVSIDIETIARSSHVVPMGTTHDERISSMNMYLLYGQIHVHICLYLNPTTTTDASQFQAKMNSKYNHKDDDKGRQRVFVLFKGYNSETAMLEAFDEFYCRGGVFQLVDLPRRYPHVLTGHNLIAYDLRVIWRRAIFLRIDQLLQSVHQIKHENSDELYHPDFNDLAIVLDLLVLTKRNMLSDKLSLAVIAAKRLGRDRVAKMDLDSTLIRRLYAYGTAAVHSSEARDDFRKVYRVAAAQPHHSADGNFDFTHALVMPVRLKRALYNCDTHLSGVPEVMPRLEEVLIYNIQDTITVTRVLLESNILSLVVDSLSSLFFLNAEESGMCGNSRRLAACLTHNGLKYGTFIAVRPLEPVPDVFHSFTDDGAGSGRRTARIVSLDTSNNKSYQGALNYARDEHFFNNVESFDFNSYYPNLSCYLNTDSTNCAVITVEFIQSLPLAIVAVFERCVRIDLVRLFAMRDPPVPVGHLLTPGYRGREIGHCLCWEDLFTLHSCEPVLAMFDMDTRQRFIGHVLHGLLVRRRQLQEALRNATTETERHILDSQQLGTKIILNSVYGVTGCPSFLYSHIPASAAVTLFGRKFLSICARLICTFYALNRLGDDAVDARAWYEAELQYLTTEAVNISSKNARIITTDDNEDDNTGDKGRQMPYSDLVCYVDTDGLKFYNPDNMDATKILRQVNEAISFTQHLTLAIEKRHDHVMILTKKKYAYCDIDVVGHVGYERHANPIVKKILSGVLRICCEPIATNPLHVIFDIFGCLYATNQHSLFERVKLNHHENESSLQRYIDSNTKDYKGDIKTVLLLDGDKTGDVMRDLYQPLAVWSIRPQPLNLAKFIRKFHKIIERLLMAARARYNLPEQYMKNPLLFYAAYHVWLDRDEEQVPNKIAHLVEFVRPHHQNYKLAAKQRLKMEDTVDSHKVILQKRNNNYICVVRDIFNQDPFLYA